MSEQSRTRQPMTQALVPPALRPPPNSIISPIALADIPHAVELTRRLEFLHSSLRASSPSEMADWLSQPDHHILGVRLSCHGCDDELIGLIVCHAGEEDFVADSFILSEAWLGYGLEHKMLRVVTEFALANGCGAVVLPLARSHSNQLARSLYASLGQGIDTLPSGELEVAFASVASCEVLGFSEAHYSKVTAAASRTLHQFDREPN